MANTNPVILYHDGCSDGMCAAWLVRKIFPQGEFIPVNYNQDPPPSIKDRQIIIVDFSYPRNVLQAMCLVASDVLVLDHYKTAKAELDDLKMDNLRITFDMEKSGARLTWDHFFATSSTPRPWLVDYVEDRDLWRFKLPYSKEISACIRSYDLEFDEWDKLAQLPTTEAIKQGRVILRYERNQLKRLMKHSFEMTLDGKKIRVVNSPVLQSELGEQLAGQGPFGGVFYIDEDQMFRWSLRSQGDMDVSDIAKKFGGGGHKNAAGFKIPMNQMILRSGSSKKDI